MSSAGGRWSALAEWLDSTVPIDPDVPFATSSVAVGIALLASVAGLLLVAIAVLGTAGTLRTSGAGFGVAVALSFGYGAWIAPSTIETFRRRTAVGAAPEVIAYAVLQAQLTPSLERAAAFASEQTPGLLGDALEPVETGTTTGRDTWKAVGREFADLDESLPRAISLLIAGIDAAPPERDELMKRALDTVLAGSRDRVARFGAAVRAPISGMYAFGVMLPLALVGLLPVVSSAGSTVSPAAIAVFYDVLLPAGLVAAGAWLAVKRPAVSRPPTGFDALRSPRGAAATLGIGIAGGVFAAVGARVLFPAWIAAIVAPGVSVGTAALYWFDPIRRRRTRVESIESGIPDAVALVGHRLATGAPLESAIEGTAHRLAGETADVLADGAAIRRRLGVPIEEAFTGRAGALMALDSPRSETAIALMLAAGRSGPTGGETLVSVAAYLRELQSVEREARRELRRTTDTLTHTAMVFGPAIAGVTVALATGMGPLDESSTQVAVGVLGSVIGGYVLILAVVLPALSVVLERGFDAAIIGQRVGGALLTASVVYPVTMTAARTVVQV
ncbi:MAG: type II secretion system protein [Halanaeroarchaeum sp.]